MMKIESRVFMDQIRSLCIERNYYTCGDNEEYGKMLTMFDGKAVTGKELEVLARDIKEHSKTDDTIYEIASGLLHQGCVSILVEE